MIAASIIGEFQDMEYYQDLITQPVLLSQLQKQLGIVNMVIKSIVNY